jgi:metal-responsive CopG/Arc/MetJ family transcriptional regulator
MSSTAKISISLPDELFRDVERVRSESAESRSDFFRRAAETLLRQNREKEAEARYVQGYLDHPETDDELAWAKLGETMLAEVQW